MDAKLSYAFGRSTASLSNHSIGTFLEERVQQNPDELAVSSHHERLQVDNKQFYADAHSLAYSIYHELGESPCGAATSDTCWP